MGILISGTTNDILVNGVSVATDAEVSSAVAPLATTAYVDGKMVLMTAQNSTSGTSIDFTGVPSWAKRITVMFNGVSTNGASPVQIQLGNTTVQTTGYLCGVSNTLNANATNGASFTSGFATTVIGGATTLLYGALNLYNFNGFSYVANGMFGQTTSANGTNQLGGSVTLSGTLDRIRITTVNGTDTFDAGSINIMYEG